MQGRGRLPQTGEHSLSNTVLHLTRIRDRFVPGIFRTEFICENLQAHKTSSANAQHTFL